MTKIILKSKRLQLQGEIIKKLGETDFLEGRIGSDLIETFKIFNGISNHSRYFLVFLFELDICCQGRFKKTNSIKQLNFFL